MSVTVAIGRPVRETSTEPLNTGLPADGAGTKDQVLSGLSVRVRHRRVQP
jgi:hypothetical protein